MFCDNKSAISIAYDQVYLFFLNKNDQVYLDRIKHVNIDRFYIKETLVEKILSTHYIHSTEQCADIFTKGLPSRVFSKLISKLVRNLHSCT